MSGSPAQVATGHSPTTVDDQAQKLEPPQHQASPGLGKGPLQSDITPRRIQTQLRKKIGPFLDLCVSSLRRGHANLLCIVPILSDVSEETKGESSFQ
jgi:hypothetical protein